MYLVTESLDTLNEYLYKMCEYIYTPSQMGHGSTMMTTTRRNQECHAQLFSKSSYHVQAYCREETGGLCLLIPSYSCKNVDDQCAYRIQYE